MVLFSPTCCVEFNALCADLVPRRVFARHLMTALSDGAGTFPLQAAMPHRFPAEMGKAGGGT